MPQDFIETDVWLTNTQAAQRLGVHPTTLRRWADQGQIPVLLTPGGHRRFAASDVERFAEERRRLRVVAGLETLWAEKALSHARSEIVSHREESFLAAYDEEDREHKRRLGRRLMGLILRFVSADEGGEELLEEARAIGRLHAENALQLGLPSRAALQAAMFFRDTVIETALELPETVHVRPEANVRMVRRINELINEVQLAIAGTYDAMGGES